MGNHKSKIAEALGRGGRVNGLAASGVDWEQVAAVKLLGVALAALILLWAIRRMFGGRR